MIVKEEPAEQTRETQHQQGQRIAVFPHMGIERAVGAVPVGPCAAAVDAIGIVMPLAPGIAVADAAIHEQAVLAVGHGHG